MYFIRLAPLKLQLQASDLPQHLAFRYLFASAVLLTFLYNPEFLNTDLPAEWNWFMVLLSAGLTGLGTWIVYRANGGAEGHDFISRFIALGWVVGIRVTLALLPLMVMLAVLWAPDAEGQGGAPMVTELVGLVLSLFFFYWRLTVHVRDVAAGRGRTFHTDATPPQAA